MSATHATIAPIGNIPRVMAIPARIFYALIASPVFLFLATLAVILFRPPDLSFYEMDRFAIAALTYFVILYALLHGQSLRLPVSVNFPLLGLLTLALFRVLTEPYASQNWSVLAAKWLVPFLLFNLAGFVFTDARSLHKLEVFCWVVLAYLSLTSVSFLLGWKSLIFPKFILDGSLGIHADRARGPFLQAVANGVALNLLALIALDSFRRHKLPKLVASVFFVLLPLAILATKTRAVWLSFSFSIAALTIISSNHRIRRACLAAVITTGVGLSIMLLICRDARSFGDRFAESSPVEFRFALYQAGWEMFEQKPLFGWSNADIQQQLENRIHEFHQESFYFHNTFLEVGVTYGILGLGLYLWLIADFLRLAKVRFPSKSSPPNSIFVMLVSAHFGRCCFSSIS